MSLLGTSRVVDFTPGLNIISGPIGSGKTSFIRLCRALCGNDFGLLPPEVRRNVAAVSGTLLLRDDEFTVVRPLTSTEDAMVDVVGPQTVLRLPAQKPRANAPLTYVAWLLDRLDLPRLEVPQAPTNPLSPQTPVTVNDYFIYSNLSQDEIDTSVFGHRQHFKNVKRKYVFQIAYGLFSVQMARLQERYREIEVQIRTLRTEGGFFERFSKDTPWENRAALEASLRAEEERLATTEAAVRAIAEDARESAEVSRLQEVLRGHDTTLADLHTRHAAEERAIDQLRRLLGQLETQNQRLTRAIADTVLVDYDFTLCPRCSAAVEPARRTDGTCYLCLQTPARTASRNDLIKEQQRIDIQISETAELMENHRTATEEILKRLAQAEEARRGTATELDYVTSSFVSSRTEEVARLAADRSESRERVRRYRDYLDLYTRLDALTRDIATLEDEQAEVEVALAAAQSAVTGAEERIQFLEESMGIILREFKVVQFGPTPRVVIDRETYLPIVNGRSFDSISSHGINVLVNIAHALAHQRTALKFDLPLPNLLFIDGLSGNIGH